MKPTDEERREVASEMRQRGYEGYLFVSAPVALEMGIDIEDYDEDFDSFSEDAWNRLADLIEPDPERTCRVLTEKRTVSQTQEIHIKSCSACGYMFGAENHCQLLPGLDDEFVLDDVKIPSFCPNCGAKVEGAAK